MKHSAIHHLWILARLPLPAKVLFSAVLMVLAMGMTGAMGQIIIHDIIPTFFSGQEGGTNGHQGHDHGGGAHHAATSPETDDDFFADMEGRPASAALSSERGDLFSDAPVVKASEPEKPFHSTEQFIWMLKWTHIHLFGMNMIFIIVGTVTFFLNLPSNTRAWLIGLPFAGIFTDIAAMWLKGYVSPAFFWLHIPGGGLFGGIFVFVFFRGMWEMWISESSAHTEAGSSFAAGA